MVLARSVRGTVPEAIDAGRGRPTSAPPRAALHDLQHPDQRRAPLRRRDARVDRASNRSHASQRHPLAGTIALPPNVDPEDYLTWLLGSTKNLHEHNVPVNEIVTALETRLRRRRAPTPVRRSWRCARWPTSARGSRRRVATTTDAPDALDGPAPAAPDVGRGRSPACERVRADPSSRTDRPRLLRRTASAGSTPTVTASGGSAFAACW